MHVYVTCKYMACMRNMFNCERMFACARALSSKHRLDSAKGPTSMTWLCSICFSSSHDRSSLGEPVAFGVGVIIPVGMLVSRLTAACVAFSQADEACVWVWADRREWTGRASERREERASREERERERERDIAPSSGHPFPRSPPMQKPALPDKAGGIQIFNKSRTC